MSRSQFLGGFSRVHGLVGVLALVAWLIVIMVWVAVVMHDAGGQKYWPYKRMYADPGTFLLVFTCIGAPLLAFALNLPIYVLRFVLMGFLRLDDEGVSQEDWLLFSLFSFLYLDAIPYLSKLLAWVIVLAALYLADSEQTTDSLLTYSSVMFNLEDKDIPTLQVVAHGLVIASAIAVRFALWLSVGVRIQNWLEHFFETRLLGKARTKAIYDYANAIAQRRGVLPAIKRFLSR